MELFKPKEIENELITCIYLCPNKYCEEEEDDEFDENLVHIKKRREKRFVPTIDHSRAKQPQYCHLCGSKMRFESIQPEPQTTTDAAETFLDSFGGRRIK